VRPNWHNPCIVQHVLGRKANMQREQTMESQLLITRELMQKHISRIEDEGMATHILEAIVINIKRGMKYAKLTRGRSLVLSLFMVTSELMVLLPAYLFDMWGKKYNRLGIRVIAADFIPMSHAKKFGSPLKFAGQTPPGELKDLQYQIKVYANTVNKLAAEKKFHMVAAHTHHMLTQVQSMETFHQALLPMARHILESIGFAAVNAARYEDQSQKRTNRLCAMMIQFQISGVVLALPVDKMAQKSHLLGAGIIENDVPYIPFHEAYRKLSA
jgi:hypothetical protein